MATMDKRIEANVTKRCANIMDVTIVPLRSKELDHRENAEYVSPYHQNLSDKRWTRSAFELSSCFAARRASSMPNIAAAVMLDCSAVVAGSSGSGSQLLHLLGDAAPLPKGARERPPRWLTEVDGEILEAVLRIVGHVADLLHPGHEHLVVVSSLAVRGPQECLHHGKLVPNECMITLDAELQGNLFHKSGFGVAKRSIKHQLAYTQCGGLHGLLSSRVCFVARYPPPLLWMRRKSIHLVNNAMS
ncbi:hypothetical protein U9M48_038018 [Paspalum notatum var. saurae]|uniref:Uncharacterized protein n=1 Tax=Paspalum notatum var. saurae TaxID=547442 RepID=A0AAQ3UL26_PASNO